MTDVYIISSNDPLSLLFKLKQLDNKRNYKILLSEDANLVLDTIEEDYKSYQKRILEDDSFKDLKVEICKRLIELRKKEASECCQTLDLTLLSKELISAIQNDYPELLLKKIDSLEKEYKLIEKDSENKRTLCKNYIENKFLEPNKLSNNEIEELCLEFYKKFLLGGVYEKDYPIPNIKIVKLSEYVKLPRNDDSFHIESSFNHDALAKLHAKDTCHNDYITEFPTIISQVVGIDLRTFGGVISRIYGVEYGNLFNIKISGLQINNMFYDWYLRSLEVLAMYYLKKDNTCYVIKKPDELKISEDKKEIYFRYGNEEFYYRNKTLIPTWLYKTKLEDLKIEDFLLLQNADAKAVFIEKFGIDRLAKLGTVIDSYENYPDNEMWAKSEYKIIDMHAIIPPRQRYNILDEYVGRARSFKYAPFLYMKNQTTGVYHLEGIHPRCKTLYDAIKMRYNGLNISDFEIKDIK